jgi:putative tricarboxylic transport membrane protein
MRFNADLASGVVLLALALGYHLATREIPRSSLSDEIGPDGLPNLLTVLLVLLGALIAGRGLIARRPTARAEADQAARQASPLRAAGFLAIGVSYMIVAPLVGYLVAIVFLIMAVALYEGMALSWRVPAVAVSGGVLFWLIFVALLGVEQPASRFWG